MNHAIHILTAEKKILIQVLKSWTTPDHPEALKDRQRKLREIEKAISEVEQALGIVEQGALF